MAAVQTGTDWGYVNEAGELVVPTRFRVAGSFSEGLAVFEQEPRGKGAAECNALAAILYADLLN